MLRGAALDRSRKTTVLRTTESLPTILVDENGQVIETMVDGECQSLPGFFLPLSIGTQAEYPAG